MFGYNIVKFKLSAFVIGGMLAGLSGCLTIYYVGSFSPGGWGVGETLFTLTCIFVGGAGNTIGVIVGASVISLIFVQLTSLLPTLQSDPSLILVARGMLIPLLLILVLRFRRAGLIPERLPRLPMGRPRQGRQGRGGPGRVPAGPRRLPRPPSRQERDGGRADDEHAHGTQARQGTVPPRPHSRCRSSPSLSAPIRAVDDCSLSVPAQ